MRVKTKRSIARIDMLIAITHLPSADLNFCELTYLSPESIDSAKAPKQHQLYRKALTDLGVGVITLNKNLDLPDSVFVEDTAIALDEIAIITSMGAESRRQESKFIETELGKYRRIERIEFPATIEGGDVLRIGTKIFVGISSRTNGQGIAELGRIVNLIGYEVVPVNVSGCLHLKTACTALNDSTVLINSNWIDTGAFQNFKKIEVPAAEPFAGNILRIEDSICIHSGFTRTANLLRDSGFDVHTIDISEFLKAEAGLTCMSLVFEK